MRIFQRIVLVVLAVDAIACGGAATAPSPVTRTFAGDLTTAYFMPTQSHTVTMCVPPINSTLLHTNLTCILPVTCITINTPQLTLTANLETNPADNSVNGTATINGSEMLRGCAFARTVNVALSFPITGTSSTVTFGGTVVSTDRASSIDFTRVVTFTGALVDGPKLSGTLTYDEQFISPSGATFPSASSSGSGTGIFDVALAAR